MNDASKFTHKLLALLTCLLSAQAVKADTIQVTTSIFINQTWYATNEYVLNGFIYVLDSASLTIEAGTVVKAMPGQDANTSCLIVTRGGKILANGTRTKPIIFTAESDDVTDPDALPIYQRGLWGGVVLMGAATLNTAVDSAGNAATPKYDVFEGLPDSQVGSQFVNRFGGTNDNDSSGVMRYVSIRHSGVVFQPNKELNGLSLAAVGRGTVLENIESYAIADDGFEFFGGTVNTRYLVSAFNDDDCFDTDQGYRGKNQFWFAIQEPGRKDNGAELNGEPNGLAVSNAPIANFEVYNATWIGAGTNTTGNRGMLIREYAAPKIYNSVLTEFGGAGVSVADVRSGALVTNGLCDLRDNLWWNFATNGVARPLAENTAAEVFFTDSARNNLNVDPQLASISRTNLGGLDPRPVSGSPALTVTRTPPIDGFYLQVGYKGAFSENNLWLRDWTFLSQKGFLPPSEVNVVNITGPVSGPTTWYATNEYVLNGFIYVLDGATLTIEPGTVVKAAPGQDANTSCLIVTRGGKIFANGTRTKPIIFTSESDDVNDLDDLPIFQRGLWGGIVLMGRSVLNTAVDATGNTSSPKYDVFEGLPDSQVSGQFVNRFGGNDDNDSSGVMRYVSIRHSGVVFQPNKELNGLSLGAVGRGTVLEHIESYAIADDGFEFFGGTVNTRYLISAFNDDDCFDADQGYRGKNQFWFAIQEPGRKDNGAELNGEPNGLAVSNAPIANFEVYNATWIGAGTNTTGNRGMLIREYAAPKIYNSVLTEFGGSGVSVADVRSGALVTNGLCDLRDNLWWNFATNGVARPLAENAAAQVFFSDTTRSNENVNPMLRSISRAPDGGLDPRPMPGSPALTTLRSTPSDGFYKPAAYKGAFDGNDLWIAGWTFLSQKGFVAPRGANTIQITANISGDLTWYRTNEYVLNGFIYVLDSAALTIEAGTVIKAMPGQDANTSCLIVTRGGKIFANGTANNPIIFTAEQDDVNDPTDLPMFQRGLWGGVVLMGKAVLNTAVDATGNTGSPKYDVFEGLPDSQVSGQFVNRFGGNDDNDFSGVMRYVSIRHSGVVFQPNKELNGLSLAAVGRSTVLENIESYAIADDGFEFFGGTVNTRYLVSAFNDDDCFDTDQGYRGKNQFWFAIQEPGRKDNGAELNGEPNGLAVSNAPIANFEVYNATWIGAGTNTTGNRGMLIREYAAPKIYNSVLTEFGGAGVSVADVRSGALVTNGLCDLRDNIWWNFATNGVARPLAENAPAEVFFTDTTRSNQNVNPMLRGISRTQDGRLDPRPLPGSPALTTLRLPPSDGFYCAAQYKGAFDSVDWATDWTALSELCILSGAGGGVPMCMQGPGDPCTSPVTLAIVRNGANVEISFTGVAGASYQLQSAADLSGSPINWASEGSPLTGTGTLTFTSPVTGGQKFFRVVCQ